MLQEGWLYLDKLKLSETEELTLLSSVNNKFDCSKLQQAALIQDRSLRRPTGATAERGWKTEGRRWQGSRHSVHMTDLVEESSEAEPNDEEDGLVAEEIAEQAHEAYMTYQNAKSKLREALKGRGVDMDEVKKRSEERLKLAKQRSFCSACKRKGHWHKDPECPLRGRRSDAPERSQEAQMTIHAAQMCDTAHSCYVTAIEEDKAADFLAGDLLAIVDTACTKTVAGHPWFEKFSDMCEALDFPLIIYNREEFFRFGASRVHASSFGVRAWFAIRGRWFMTEVAIVPCTVPLLFSRPVI